MLRVDYLKYYDRILDVPHKTQQRSSILAALDEIGRPVTPPELLDYSSVKSPGLGLATVYRVLKKLVETGKARKIEISGVPPHYEVLREKHHHHFFVCEECRSMSVLTGCSGGFKKILPAGYKMTSHEVVIYGECQKCVE